MGPFRLWTWCGKICFRLPSKASFCRLPQEKPVSKRPAQFTFSIHHFALLFVISKKSMHINAMISQINWKPDCFYCLDIFSMENEYCPNWTATFESFVQALMLYCFHAKWQKWLIWCICVRSQNYASKIICIWRSEYGFLFPSPF